MKNIGHTDIVEALLALQTARSTGAIAFNAEGVETRIYVDDGIPVFAEAGALGETLGHLLVREHIITDVQCATVVRKMADTLLDDSHANVRFGEVIVELGILTQAELAAALATQIEKRIIGCVARGAGDWSFEPSASVKHAIRHAVPVRTILVEAAAIFSEQRIDALLSPTTESFPVMLANAAKIADDYGLDERAIVSLIRFDGTQSMTSILDSDAGDVQRLVSALVIGRSVELLATAGAKRPPFATMKARPSGRFHAVRVKVSERPAELTPPPARSASLPPARNEREATLFAEDEFQSGKRFFSQGLLEQSHVQLVFACDRSPQIPLYRLYETFVGSRLKGAFDDLAFTKALALKLAKEDAACAFAHYVLGYVALAEQDNDVAKRYFIQAFRLDSELRDAGRQARKLASSKPGLSAQPISPHGSLPARPAPKTTRPLSAQTRLRLLAGILAFVTVGAIGYVAAVRAGVWSDYQEVR